MPQRQHVLVCPWRTGTSLNTRILQDFYLQWIPQGFLQSWRELQICSWKRRAKISVSFEYSRCLYVIISSESQTTLPPDDGYNPSGFAFNPYPSLPSFDGNIPQNQPADDWHIADPNDEANKNFNQPGPFYYSDPNYTNFYQAPSDPEPGAQKEDPIEIPADNDLTEKEPEKTEKDIPVEEPQVPQVKQV